MTFRPHTIGDDRLQQVGRWTRRGVVWRLLAALAEQRPADEIGYLDSTHVKAHRSAHEGK